MTVLRTLPLRTARRPRPDPEGEASGIGGLARGVAAGAVGTTAMSITLAAEKHLRRHTRGPVDYDASYHVVTAAGTVLRHQPRTRAGARALFLLVHWGYGSAVGMGYLQLRRHSSERRAMALFFAGCQSMAMTLFPTLGGTPPPWRWRRSVLLSSLIQHAVYVVGVAAGARRLTASRQRPTPAAIKNDHGPAPRPSGAAASL